MENESGGSGGPPVIRVVDPLEIAQRRVKDYLHYHPQKSFVLGDETDDLQVAEIMALISIAQSLSVLAQASGTGYSGPGAPKVSIVHSILPPTAKGDPR